MKELLILTLYPNRKRTLAHYSWDFTLCSLPFTVQDWASVGSNFIQLSDQETVVKFLFLFAEKKKIEFRLVVFEIFKMLTFIVMSVKEKIPCVPVAEMYLLNDTDGCHPKYQIHHMKMSGMRSTCYYILFISVECQSTSRKKKKDKTALHILMVHTGIKEKVVRMS